MGNVIARNAGAERIIDAISKTLTRAAARGGQIQSLAEARLTALHAALAALEQQLNQARTADDVLHAALMARDNESDLAEGRTHPRHIGARSSGSPDGFPPSSLCRVRHAQVGWRLLTHRHDPAGAIL